MQNKRIVLTIKMSRKKKDKDFWLPANFSAATETDRETMINS